MDNLEESFEVEEIVNKRNHNGKVIEKRGSLFYIFEHVIFVSHFFGKFLD